MFCFVALPTLMRWNLDFSVFDPIRFYEILLWLSIDISKCIVVFVSLKNLNSQNISIPNSSKCTENLKNVTFVWTFCEETSKFVDVNACYHRMIMFNWGWLQFRVKINALEEYLQLEIRGFLILSIFIYQLKYAKFRSFSYQYESYFLEWFSCY